VSDERRYSDEEVEVILHRAVEQSVERRQPTALARDGMTLSELESIGQEVGVSAEHVREAAASLDRVQGIQREWGVLPMSVYHVTPLSRTPTDREWSELVADLRQTFRAKGKLDGAGGMRGWTNSNLHAYVEPTGSGWQLRMGTTKGNAKAFIGMGGAMLGMTLVMAVAAVLGLGVGADELTSIVGTLGPLGVGFLGFGALQLPGWSRTRQKQMEGLERRMLARMFAADREEEPSGG